MAGSKPSRAVPFVSVDDIGDVAEWLRQDSGETDAGWIERLTAYFAALRADPVRAAEEMREACALWHEEVAAERDRRVMRIVVNTAGRERLRLEALTHRDSAMAIRSLPTQPAAEGGAE